MERITVLHCIEAWRYWYICHSKQVNFPYGLMSGLGISVWFPKKPKRAICSKWGTCRRDVNDHKNFNLPTFNGKCGIQGFKSKEIALGKGKEIGSGGMVLGRVALWGKIYEDAEGIYRAKWAYPLSLELGICWKCGNLAPLDKAYLVGLCSSGIGVICESCRPTGENRRSLKILSPPGWHQLIAQKYGIPVEI